MGSEFDKQQFCIKTDVFLIESNKSIRCCCSTQRNFVRSCVAFPSKPSVPSQRVLLTGSTECFYSAAEPSKFTMGNFSLLQEVKNKGTQTALKSMNKEAQLFFNFVFLIRSLSRPLWTWKKTVFGKVRGRKKVVMWQQRHNFCQLLRAIKLLSISACTHACISVPFVFLKTSAPLSGAQRGREGEKKCHRKCFDVESVSCEVLL